MARSKVKVSGKKASEVDLLSVVSQGIDGLISISAMAEELIVPTMFTSFNRASGVGGLPLRRMVIVHGPNQVGKTTFGTGLMESLRMAGHASFRFDTEFADESRWANCLVDGDKNRLKRPGDLNELFDDIQTALKNLQKAKEDRKLGKQLQGKGCVFLVDTITKLMPREVMEKIEKEGIDKAYPIQAMFISIWSTAIIPMLYRTDSSLILVIQERVKQGAKPNQKQWRLPGGNSMQFDNSIRVRVSWAEKVLEGKDVVGVQSHYTVENNKADGTTFEEGSIFTSNGKGRAPKGFDHIREAIAEAKKMGLIHVEKSPSRLVVDFGGDDVLQVAGGMVDLEEVLRGSEDNFRWLVSMLNRR